MRNAMAIILGANLGTTLDSWVVATLGFNMDIEVVSYPPFVQEASFLSSGSRKHIDTFPIFFFLVYCLSGCPYENSHGSTGKILIFHTMRRCL
jgi:phosphate:Na+ symporter